MVLTSLSGVNVPEPADPLARFAVQTKLASFVTFPDKITSFVDAQRVWSAPASAVGAGLMVSRISSVTTSAHDPLDCAVNTSVTIPDSSSAGV